MKVYVSELPKDCMSCPCFNFGGDFSCGLDDGCNDYFRDEIDGGVCPLQLLADHDKKVRKEVIEILDKRIHNYLNNKCRYAEINDVHSIIKQVMKEDLDQIGE